MSSMQYKFRFVIIWIFQILPQTLGTWWFISKISTQSFSMGPLLCDTIPGLVKNQRQMCWSYPKTMFVLRNGLKMGVRECQIQFYNHRWNCSTANQNLNLFGKFMSKGTKETAFLYSIASAGIAHAVTRACSRGELMDCACDPDKIKGEMALDPSGQLFNWAGCSDNVDFGCKFARLFVDAREKRERDARALMNMHNNKAGRKAIKKATKLECKCHGVSGSCNIRTCWRSMSNFRQIGQYIKHRYDGSKAIMMNQDGTSLVVKRDMIRAPKTNDLVFLEESPSYCQNDKIIGSIGTAGRLCDKNSNGPEGCAIMCCGRGYDTKVVRKVFKCRCKFQWCCRVKCQECRKWIEEYTCKKEPKPVWNSVLGNYRFDYNGI